MPDQEEVRVAITRLKKNYAAGIDGLPAELFKYGGDQKWSDESMPDDWNLSMLCPIHKKSDPKICAKD